MFVSKLLKSPDGDQVRGPLQDEMHRISKVNGRVLVGGAPQQSRPWCDGRRRVFLSLVVDHALRRAPADNNEPITAEERQAGHVVLNALLPRVVSPGSLVITKRSSSSVLLPDNVPRSSWSRKATEANNALVSGGKGGLTKAASPKGEPLERRWFRVVDSSSCCYQQASVLRDDLGRQASTVKLFSQVLVACHNATRFGGHFHLALFRVGM